MHRYRMRLSDIQTIRTGGCQSKKPVWEDTASLNNTAPFSDSALLPGSRESQKNCQFILHDGLHFAYCMVSVQSRVNA